MIIAKPVVENQYWILNNESGKVGQIEANTNGFIVKIGKQVQEYSNIKTIQMRTNIQFITVNPVVNAIPHEVQGFPTDGPAYNPVFNMHVRIPMFTKSEKSKSWYAAGYYKLKQASDWETVFCPKVILLQRYTYSGPVKYDEGFTYQ